ncbi:MAG: tyrosine-type recombinase/integrase [Deltaproteobacteria bacterium]
MAINSNTKKLDELRERLSELPDFIFNFVQRYIKNTTAINTKIAYCKDSKIFLEFLKTLPKYKSVNNIKDFTLEHIKKLEKVDIEDYLLYLENYSVSYETRTGKAVSLSIQNDNHGKMRKLSSLRSLFDYLFSSELIEKDVTQLVRMPKIHDRIKSKLSVDEVVNFLDTIEKGSGLTKKEKSFHEATKIRDLAIATTLLGTGIRVSELVNLNISDINFKESHFKVTRKGQNEEIIFCNDEVISALRRYYEERIQIKGLSPEFENAFFLSTQERRMDEKSVRNMIKKYTKKCGIIKNITPHALRRTFGTNLYNEVEDVYLVAELLGHKSVETTKKHYAELNIERKRKALKEYKLRD